jgi:hypothetical protein
MHPFGSDDIELLAFVFSKSGNVRIINDPRAVERTSLQNRARARSQGAAPISLTNHIAQILQNVQFDMIVHSA